MVGTIGKPLKHLPSRFCDMKSSSKRWICGFSRSLHNEGLNITFWNDNNAVVFLDNDLESAQENWNQIETPSGESRLSVYAPLVAQIYWENYGMVDRPNQPGSYHVIDRRTVRKQNRVLFDGIETYTVINQHTIYQNSANLVQDLPPKRKSGREFRFDVVKV